MAAMENDRVLYREWFKAYWDWGAAFLCLKTHGLLRVCCFVGSHEAFVFGVWLNFSTN